MTGINFSVSGEYNIIVRKSDGTEEATGWFPNLILNQGLNQLGQDASSLLMYASVGTGISVPTDTQTNLDSPIAYSSAGQSSSTVNIGSPTYAGIHTRVYSFPQGSVIGNISEVGIGTTNTDGSLFSRALILDVNSNPTSITLIAIDQLIIYYRLTMTPPLTDMTGSVVLNGVTYNYVSRICNANYWGNIEYVYTNSVYFNSIYACWAFGPDAALAPITANTCAGTQSRDSATAVSTGVYTIDTYHRDWTIVYGPSAGNLDSNGAPLGGIKGLHILGGGSWSAINFQIVFDAVIPKVNTNQLSITFRYSWGR